MIGTCQKKCAVAGCEELISRRFLMCPRHWAMVPNSMQRAVYVTLQNWRSGDSARAYIDACEAATAAVARKLEEVNEGPSR